MNEKRIPLSDLQNLFLPTSSDEEINQQWRNAVEGIHSKIVVLDDDPTGTQTVHGIPVYTSWEIEDLRKVLNEDSRVVYILINSRAFTAETTESVHKQLIMDLERVSQEERIEYILISRGDSTLRGHYPLETQTLYTEMSKIKNIDGEIIIPFFLEGGRLTYKNVHYVKDNDDLIPVSNTEFSKDSTFGFKSSNLKEWIEEKTKGEYPASDVISISINMLRDRDIKKITDTLLGVEKFNKIIVNALNYTDLKVFLIGLSKALQRGKRFIFRTAASFVQVIGGISPKPYLNNLDLLHSNNSTVPGLIIVGSHVNKTTRQLNKLRELSDIKFIEWDVCQAETKEKMESEVSRVLNKIENVLASGESVCVYTSRDYYRSDLENKQSEKNLVFSTRVSSGLVQIVQKLKYKPAYIVAKGGITSSDIAVKGLGVKRGIVLGQIQPGIPVLELGSESRFPGVPYIIFPGNVGDDETMKKVVEILEEKQEVII